jgi:two-component system cell cycle response regulator DivK
MNLFGVACIRIVSHAGAFLAELECMALCYIVDDHGDTRDGYAEYLKAKGFRVETAGRGDELRSLLDGEVPEAVLMDIRMPQVDGCTLTREIKANPRTRDVVVLVISASVRADDRRAAESAGADAFIAKPCDPQCILDELTRLREERGTSSTS